MSRNPSINPSDATVVQSTADLRAEIARLRRDGRRVAFVPTMGALHEGHLTLIRDAGADGHAVVVSVFVNPTQFGPDEDFARYPRDAPGDIAAATAAGASVVFLPFVDEVYPDGDATTVSVDGPSNGLEGAARPGHFDGVATVVARLLGMVRPDRLVMGGKDAQQVAVVGRMMRDLAIDDIDLVVAPIVREADGLAMSSRNAYLSTAERAAATALVRALRAAEALATDGEGEPARLAAAAREVVESEPLVRLEYVALVDPETFAPLRRLDRAATLCIAASIGTTRLIDNIQLQPIQRRNDVPPFGRTMLKSKIHRATVTDANLDYVGSITVDLDLLEAADIRPYEQVQVLDINNGARFETYAIEGARGSGAMCLNGAAARLVQPGDLVIVLTYAQYPERGLDGYEPLVVHVDADNRQVHHVAEDTVPAGWNADA